MIEGGVVRWSVAQIWSKRAKRIVDDVQGIDIGTFTPTYARRWISEGKPSSRETPLFPGYLFFRVTDNWGDVSNIDGVIRVLSHGLTIADAEALQLSYDHRMGTHDDIAPAIVEAVAQRKRRKPRPSKRARMRAAQRRAQQGI